MLHMPFNFEKFKTECETRGYTGAIKHCTPMGNERYEMFSFTGIKVELKLDKIAAGYGCSDEEIYKIKNAFPLPNDRIDSRSYKLIEIQVKNIDAEGILTQFFEVVKKLDSVGLTKQFRGQVKQDKKEFEARGSKTEAVEGSIITLKPASSILIRIPREMQGTITFEFI